MDIFFSTIVVSAGQSKMQPCATYHFRSESLMVENILGKFAKDNIKLRVVGK